MNFSNRHNLNMTCALKVDTSRKGWHEIMGEILKKIGGVSYDLDAKKGMIYISGKVDPKRILKKIAQHRKNVELCWMKTEDLNYDNNNNNNNHVIDYGALMQLPSCPCMEPQCHTGGHNYPPPIMGHHHQNKGYYYPPNPMTPHVFYY